MKFYFDLCWVCRLVLEEATMFTILTLPIQENYVSPLASVFFCIHQPSFTFFFHVGLSYFFHIFRISSVFLLYSIFPISSIFILKLLLVLSLLWEGFFLLIGNWSFITLHCDVYVLVSIRLNSLRSQTRSVLFTSISQLLSKLLGRWLELNMPLLD